MRTKILVLGALPAAALLAATAAHSTPQAAPLPAGAGYVTAFAFDPAHPNVVYTATEPGPGGSHDRVYRSTDGGARWQRLFSRRGWFRAYALAVDPKHPRTVYVGGGRAVYKTTDAGRTWRTFNRGLLPPPGINRGEGWVTWLALDPANHDVLYEYDEGGTLRKSADGGRTWNVVLSGAKKRFFAWSLLIAPRPPLALYAAFASTGCWPCHGGKPFKPRMRRGIYKSTDGGRTWRRLGMPAPPPAAVSTAGLPSIPAAADPQRQTLYFAEQDRIFASTDAGRTWRDIGRGLPHDQPVSALAAGGGTVVASLGTDGVYTSANEGRTWMRSWPASGPVRGPAVDLLTVDPADPAYVVAAAGNRVLRSNDGGRTWTGTP